MPDTPERDAVKEARELIDKASKGPWQQSALAAAYVISLAEGHEIIASFGEYGDGGDLAHEFKNADNNMALVIRAPELLHALADELEAIRKERNIAVRFLSKQGYERCAGHCDSWHERLTSPPKENDNVPV